MAHHGLRRRRWLGPAMMSGDAWRRGVRRMMVHIHDAAEPCSQPLPAADRAAALPSAAPWPRLRENGELLEVVRSAGRPIASGLDRLRPVCGTRFQRNCEPSCSTSLRDRRQRSPSTAQRVCCWPFQLSAACTLPSPQEPHLTAHPVELAVIVAVPHTPCVSNRAASCA